jgi:hypothetical protein
MEKRHSSTSTNVLLEEHCRTTAAERCHLAKHLAAMEGWSKNLHESCTVVSISTRKPLLVS